MDEIVVVTEVKLLVKNVVYTPGEAAVAYPEERAHPGHAAYVEYDAVYVMRENESFRVDVMLILADYVFELIEEQIIKSREGLC